MEEVVRKIDGILQALDCRHKRIRAVQNDPQSTSLSEHKRSLNSAQQHLKQASIVLDMCATHKGSGAYRTVLFIVPGVK